MKHDDVVAALKVISEKGMAINISKDDLQDLRLYNLIEVAKGTEKEKIAGLYFNQKGPRNA
jgi:hypothetical protein